MTSRNDTLRRLSPENTYCVEELCPEEAITLLFNASRNDNMRPIRVSSQMIASALGYLSLASAHVAGYILVYKCYRLIINVTFESVKSSMTSYILSSGHFPKIIAYPSRLLYRCL